MARNHVRDCRAGLGLPTNLTHGAPVIALAALLIAGCEAIPVPELPPESATSSVAGEVVDEAGPTQEVEVRLVDQEGIDLATPSAPQGAFQAEGVPPGSYRVLATGAGHVPAVADFTVAVVVAGSRPWDFLLPLWLTQRAPSRLASASTPIVEGAATLVWPPAAPGQMVELSEAMSAALPALPPGRVLLAAAEIVVEDELPADHPELMLVLPISAGEESLEAFHWSSLAADWRRSEVPVSSEDGRLAVLVPDASGVWAVGVDASSIGWSLATTTRAFADTLGRVDATLERRAVEVARTYQAARGSELEGEVDRSERAWLAANAGYSFRGIASEALEYVTVIAAGSAFSVVHEWKEMEIELRYVAEGAPVVRRGRVILPGRVKLHPIDPHDQGGGGGG